MADDKLPLTVPEIREKMISSFMKETSSSREEAKSFLETHQWDIFAAVSDFTEHNVSDAAVSAFTVNNVSDAAAAESMVLKPSDTQLISAVVALSRNPFSSKRTADTPCESETSKRRELAGNKPTLGGSDDYDGGEQSETTIVQEPEEGDDVDDKDDESDEEVEPQVVLTFIITMWRNGFTVDDGPLHTLDTPEDVTFIEIIQGLESPCDLNPKDNQIRHRVKIIRRQDEDFNQDDVDDKEKESDVERPVQYSARIVSAEPHEVVTFIVTMWRNGFTFEDGPLKTMDNPEDASFIEIVEKLESPRYLNPQDDGTRFRVKLIRRQDEDFIEAPNLNTLIPFQGVGRTLVEPKSAATEPPASSESLTTTPQPSISLVVDPAAPWTSINFRLADGTHISSRFNLHHTVRDVRGFIDESRPGGSKDYQLLVGFPPKPLLDFDQTIEQAGISDSVLIQRL